MEGRGQGKVALLLAVVAALRIGTADGSYLDRPRIHFSGSFQADVSTVNNFDSNYKIGTTLTPFGNHNWNPNGTGDFRFYDMRVTSVTYFNGTHSQKDPIVGLPIFNTDTYTAGKLVDLDVDVQLEKSEIWGLHVGLNWGKPNEIHHNAFIGHVHPPNLAHDVWKRGICLENETTHNYSSVAKSVIKNVKWAERIDSELLMKLQEVTEPGYLSVRMVVYFMVRDPSPNNYTFGHIRGTIGPSILDEPTQFTGRRKLHFEEVKQPPPSFFPGITQCRHAENLTAWIYNVPFRLIQIGEEGEKLVADFGNSVTMDKYQNLLNLGNLTLGVYSENQTCVEPLGTIEYQTDNWLKTTAGIQEFPNEATGYLTPDQLELLRDNPVVILHDWTPTIEQFAPDCPYEADIRVSDEEITRLTYCNSSGKSGVLMLKEKPVYVRPWREFIFRANPEEVHTFELFVTRYGKAYSNVTVNLFPSGDDGSGDDWGTRKPVDGVTYNKSVQTNDKGIATFHLHAHNVGEPRKKNDIDGQVYKYSYNVTGYPNVYDFRTVVAPTQATQDVLTSINDAAILVFSNVSFKEPYTWVDHVQPIFQQYSQLYPVMQRILNMSNYTDVKMKAEPLRYALLLPIEHPSHMPVSRDLSKAKREMILAWLKNDCPYDCSTNPPPPPQHRECVPIRILPEESLARVPVPLPESCREGLEAHKLPHDTYSDRVGRLGYKRTASKVKLFGDLDYKQDCMNVDWQRIAFQEKRSMSDLHCMLQTAIRLEFSTLPPYLTALYSIVDGCNVQVQERIHSVIMQEMLHMAQSSNLLIALGGKPIINSDRFSPRYPGPLPGGVLPGLTVHLKQASREHIRHNFMAIEFPRETKVDLDHPEFHHNTIGDFYALVNKTLNELYEEDGDEIFCKTCFKNEVEWPLAPNVTDGGVLHIVRDIDSAHAAIQEIVEQGEGVGPFDPTSGIGSQLAHYYKFEEIVCGNQLIKNETGGYQFTGPEIDLDEAAIYPMVDDPRTGNLVPDTNAFHYSRIFNEVYRQLLNRLHDVFNGNPNGFGDAVSIMHSLKIHAVQLMMTPINEDGTTAGPAWEYEVV